MIKLDRIAYAGLFSLSIFALGCAGAPLPAVQEPLASQEWKDCAADLKERQSMGLIDDLTLDSKALLCNGVVAAAEGKTNESLEMLTEAGVKDPQDFRPHYMSGRVLAAAGRYEEALAAFERSQERFPQMEAPTERLGRDAAKKEGDTVAKNLLVMANKRGLCPYGCKGFLAKLHTKAKETDKAEALYKKMIKEDPGEPSAYVGMAAAKNSQGDHKSESEWLTKATKAKNFSKLGKSRRAEIHYSHAFSRYNARKYKGASKSIDRAISLKDGKSDWYVLAGWIQLKLQNPPIALVKFDKAVEFKASSAAAHIGRGDALIKLNRYADAEAAITKARGLDPSDSVIILKLAYAKALQNKKEEARSLMEEAKAKNPDHLPAELVNKVNKLL